MSWTLVVGISVGAYLFKVVGLLGVGERQMSERALRLFGLLPPALFAGLIVVQTVGGGSGAVVLDARLAGMLVAAVAVWRQAPFLIVVASGVVATAALRMAS